MWEISVAGKLFIEEMDYMNVLLQRQTAVSCKITKIDHLITAVPDLKFTSGDHLWLWTIYSSQPTFWQPKKDRKITFSSLSYSGTH